ncbi:MAG: transposase [Chitinophagaceae bacterium]|nr:MAG: transposase [Chitinophagaceae bacterium]
MFLLEGVLSCVMPIPRNAALLARKLERYRQSVKDRRNYLRMQAVLLVLRGETSSRVAGVLSCSRQAVNKWVRCYLASGAPSSLLTQARSGRPRKGGELHRETISKALMLNPFSLGYKVGAWTVALLCPYLLDDEQIVISPHTLRRRLHQWGFRYKRPRYVYEEKEPSLAQKKGLSSAS